jgi:ribonuclease HII
MDIDPWLLEGQAWESGYRRVAGVDEVGRGPLAGPVVAAAVVLPETFAVQGVDDSKKLTPRLRERLCAEIYRYACSVGIGMVDPGEIDRTNILQAALQSMAMAVANLHPPPDCLLIDGTHCLALPLAQRAIIGGDARSVSIAAASIVAKVTRDRIMEEYDHIFPQYGFSRHKGYPTHVHREALRRFGCCPIHRKSFKGVKEHMPPGPLRPFANRRLF